MHVRRRAKFIILFKVRYSFVYRVKPLYLDIMGNHMSNIACKEKVCIFMKLLVNIKSGEVSNPWLKLYYLKSNLQQTQAGVLILDSNGDYLIYNGVGVHDPVKTIEKMSIINNNSKGMS
jgi:hypothetical protein